MEAPPPSPPRSPPASPPRQTGRQHGQVSFKCDSSYLYRVTPPLQVVEMPREIDISLQENSILEGDLVEVQLEIWEQLHLRAGQAGSRFRSWVQSQREKSRQGGQSHSPFLYPFFIFSNLSDAPVTRHNLRVSLLGHEELGLGRATRLVCGPSSTFSAVDVGTSGIPHPKQLEHEISDPTESVGRLYVCESIDNSLQALRCQRDSLGDDPKVVHVFMMSDLKFLQAPTPFICTYDNGKGVNTSDELLKSFTYGLDPMAGNIRYVNNDGSVLGWADAMLSSFGVGHQKAAFQRGKVLTAMSRGESSDTIIEGSKDLDTSKKMYNQGKQAESWTPKLELRPISGPSHETTSERRGQAWEWRDLTIREIVRQASMHRSFFLEIVSRLNNKVLEHIAESPLVIYKELAHMYFFYTPLPQHFSPPFNVGYQYGPVQMHLHVAKKQPTDTGVFEAAFKDFRLDLEPWEGWPLQGPASESQLHHECVPARLLRLVKSNSTFDQPLHLPKMDMDIKDAFVFGFSNEGMRGEGGCPIQLVKLHYLPNNGSVDLKQELELQGYGRVKSLSASRLVDIFFQGRLVPFAAPMQEMHVLTEAVKGLRRDRSKKFSKDEVKRTIKSRIFGQIFLQGAGAKGLVDDTKFHLGSVKLGLEDPITCGGIVTSYYSVRIQDGKQFFKSFPAEDLIHDLKLWYGRCEDTFERGYKLNDEVTEQEMDEMQRKCMVERKGKYYKELKHVIGRQPTFYRTGDELYTKISVPQVCPGKNREKTPVKVLGFYDPEGAGSPGSLISVLVQLLPVECFGEKIQEYALDGFLKSFLEPDADGNAGKRMEKFLVTLRNQPRSIQLMAECQGHPLAVHVPLQLVCKREDQEVIIQPKLLDLVVTSWLKPDFQFMRRGDTQQIRTKATPHTYPTFTLEQEVLDMSGSKTYKKQADLLGNHFRSIIPASMLCRTGQLKACYTLKHREKVFTDLKLDIIVKAGPPHSLQGVSQPQCRIGETFRLVFECVDVCHNPVSFPATSPINVKAIVSPEDDLRVKVKGATVTGQTASIAAYLTGSMKSLAPSFGRSPNAPKTAKLDVEVQQVASGLKGKGSVHILPGPPVRLVPAPGMAFAEELENGSFLQPMLFIVEDAEGCPINLDGEQWEGWIKVQGAFQSGDRACGIDGCYINTPAVLVDAGTGLASESELQVQVDLKAGSKAIPHVSSFRLLPSKRPRKVVLQLGQGPALQQLGSDQLKHWSERSDPKMLQEARRSAADKGCTEPPAFLLQYPNASKDASCIENLQLSLFSDRGPWGMDENDIELYVRPNSSNQKFIVDQGRVSGFKAPGLEKQAHFYFVRCSRQEVDDKFGFFFVIAAIEPPPTMWQWHSPVLAGTAAAGAEALDHHPRKRFRSASGALTLATEDGQALLSVSIGVLQPLSAKLCACTAADAGKAVRRASSPRLSILTQPEPASSSIEFVVQTSSGTVEHLGQGPVEWTPERDLCLWGAAGGQCCLLLEGGGLKPASLPTTLTAGHPSDFTLHGLPGCPEILPQQRQQQLLQDQLEQQQSQMDQQPQGEQSSYQWDCHQDISSLLVVLRDAYGNATDASPPASSMCLSFECQNLSSFQVNPTTLKLSPARLADCSLQAFDLVNRNACRIHAAPQATDLIAKLLINQTGPEQNPLRKQLRVSFQASGKFIHAVRLVPLPPLAQGLIAGTALQSPIARLSLIKDTGLELKGAEALKELLSLSCLKAWLEGAAEACCVRAEGSELLVCLGNAPTKAGPYNLKAVYTERRPAQASALLGSQVLHLASDSVASVNIKAGSPSQLQEVVRHPAGDIYVGNSSSVPGITTLLLDSIELQLADKHGNAAEPSTQQVTVHLSIQPAIPPAEPAAATTVPKLQPTDASLNEQGKTIICGLCIEEGSCTDLGADSAVLVLQACTDNVTPYRLRFTFYDTFTRSREEVLASQRAQQEQLEQERLDLLQTMTSQKQTRMQDVQARLQSLEGERAWLLQDMQQKLQDSEVAHLPLAAHVLGVLSSAEQQGWAGVQGISDAVASMQSEGRSAPQDSTETVRIRHCVQAFCNASPGSSSQVLGLVLDLVQCKTLPGGTLQRIISWRCGASGLHVVVVKDTQTQGLLNEFAQQQHNLRLDIRVLGWLHWYKEPEHLDMQQQANEDMRQQAEGYSLPFFLASACEVTSNIPKALKPRLLATVLGRNTIMLSTLEQAISYRQQQVPRNPKKSDFCPELLTLTGHRITEDGDICGGTCPEQVLPLLGTSDPPMVQEIYTMLQQDADLLNTRMRERTGLEQEQDTLDNDLGPGSDASAAQRRLDFLGSTVQAAPGQTSNGSHAGPSASTGASLHETDNPEAWGGAGPRRAEQQPQPEQVPKRPRQR